MVPRAASLKRDPLRNVLLGPVEVGGVFTVSLPRVLFFPVRLGLSPTSTKGVCCISRVRAVDDVWPESRPKEGNHLDVENLHLQ